MIGEAERQVVVDYMTGEVGGQVLVDYVIGRGERQVGC